MKWDPLIITSGGDSVISGETKTISWSVINDPGIKFSLHHFESLNTKERPGGEGGEQRKNPKLKIQISVLAGQLKQVRKQAQVEAHVGKVIAQFYTFRETNNNNKK